MASRQSLDDMWYWVGESKRLLNSLKDANETLEARLKSLERYIDELERENSSK